MTIKTANSVQQLITSISGNTINLGAATSGNRTLAAALAAPGAKIAVATTDVAFRAQDDEGNWKNGKCTLTAAGQVTQTSITSSSAAGADVTLTGSVKTFLLVIDENDLNALLSAADGIAVAALNDAGALQASDVLVVSRGGVEYRTTLAAIATLLGSAADVTAPTLTSATAAANGPNAATGSVTTNEANGTLFSMASTNASETSAAVIAAGVQQAITSAGAKTVAISGLAANTTYRLHHAHRDAASNVAATATSSATFTTASAAAVPATMAAPTLTKGDGKVSVAWAVPALNGGTFVSATFTASTGQTKTVTDTASPVDFTLPNGTAVTVTGKVTNSVGPAAAASPASNSVTPAAAVVMPAYELRTTDAGGNKINGVSYFPDNTSSQRVMAGTSPNFFTKDANTAISVRKADGTTNAPNPIHCVWSKSSTVCPIAYADTQLPANSVNGNTAAWTDAVGGANLIYGDTFIIDCYLRGTPGTYYLWVLTPDGFVGVYDNGRGTPIGWTVVAP